MNKSKTSLSRALGYYCALIALAFAAPPSGYQLAWSDEFDQAVVDTRKWLYREDSSGSSNRNSTQQAKNVSLQDGFMHIALRKETARGKNYTGGGLISRREFSHGYYEARMKMPATLGWHSSFWMSDYDESNPDKVGGIGLHEMDVCEQDSWKHDSYTRALWMRKPKVAGKAPKLEGWKRIPTPDLTKDFHVWGCEFTPTTVSYFFEGQLIKTWDITGYETGGQRIWLTSIAINLGNKTGNPVDGELPAEMVVDYVRFYEKKQ